MSSFHRFFPKKGPNKRGIQYYCEWRRGFKPYEGEEPERTFVDWQKTGKKLPLLTGQTRSDSRTREVTRFETRLAELDAPLRRPYLQDVCKFYFEQFPFNTSKQEGQIIDLLVAAGAIPDPWLGENGKIHGEYEGHRYFDGKAKMVEGGRAASEKQRLEAQAKHRKRERVMPPGKTENSMKPAATWASRIRFRAIAKAIRLNLEPPTLSQIRADRVFWTSDLFEATQYGEQICPACKCDMWDGGGPVRLRHNHETNEECTEPSCDFCNTRGRPMTDEILNNRALDQPAVPLVVESVLTALGRGGDQGQLSLDAKAIWDEAREASYEATWDRGGEPGSGGLDAGPDDDEDDEDEVDALLTDATRRLEEIKSKLPDARVSAMEDVIAQLALV